MTLIINPVVVCDVTLLNLIDGHQNCRETQYVHPESKSELACSTSEVCQN
jgi:hypothetical protein